MVRDLENDYTHGIDGLPKTVADSYSYIQPKQVPPHQVQEMQKNGESTLAFILGNTKPTAAGNFTFAQVLP
eukprot:6291579-Ditylum_brightwellii.AAC.3